jgi:RimJ/RimL family protein N-acetyltransferase
VNALPEGPGARLFTQRLRLRPTVLSDLDYVVSVERDPVNLPFITPWERPQHEAAIRFPDFRHFIVEAGPDMEATGFVILIGCRNPHKNLELKRMVIQRKGQGVGRATLRVVKRIVFDDLGAHRLWLDVKDNNVKAQGFYRDEGFVEEGRLREAVKSQEGYRSLVVLSMLQREFESRRADALEAAR